MDIIEKCKEKEIKDYRKYLFTRYTARVIPAEIARIKSILFE